MLTAATLLLLLDTHAAVVRDVALAPADSDADGVSADQVDLSGLEPLDPGIRAALAAKLRDAIAHAAQKHGVPAAKLRVAVGWNDVATFDYRLRIRFEAHDGMDVRTDDRPTGPDASESALGGMVEAALDRLLDDWERDRKAQAAALPPPVVTLPPGSVPGGDGGPKADRAPRSSPLGAMGWSGVGLLLAGAASVGAGVGLFALDTTDHPTESTKLRDWQVGAIAFTVAGGAAMITGAALVGVDARRRAADRKLRVAPSAGATGGGLSLAGRF